MSDDTRRDERREGGEGVSRRKFLEHTTTAAADAWQRTLKFFRKQPGS